MAPRKTVSRFSLDGADDAVVAVSELDHEQVKLLGRDCLTVRRVSDLARASSISVQAVGVRAGRGCHHTEMISRPN
jgi:hypothetical protein